MASIETFTVIYKYINTLKINLKKFSSPYVDSDYQPVYFVADSIKKALEDVRSFAYSICPKYSNIYYPLTRTVKQFNNKEMVKNRVTTLKKECEEMQRELEKIIIKE
ncbi:unnamed protein product [Meloidogyne enterolobii]|uniref:Uncharacterized protein n=1 Tax=Meloidogyne enterolobii TaxID=390850 RepID=A0ACB0YMB3_MELEN